MKNPIGVKNQATRRELLQGILGAAAVAVVPSAQAASNENERILDIHTHPLWRERTAEQFVEHQDFHKITTSILLPGAGWMSDQIGLNRAYAEVRARWPEKFIHFACADPAESSSIDVLRGNVERGARGFGEMKFHVAADSPEMHRVYKLAEELSVPVLIHFQYEAYNTGIRRFSAVLKKYPKVNFLGHAQTWWGNISADLNPTDMYPTGKVKPGGLTDRLLADYPNMYGDLSAGSGLNAMTRDPDFGPDFLHRHQRKLIWGSDCDCRDGKGGGTGRGNCLAGRSLAAVRRLVPDAAARSRILYENGATVLGFPSSKG